MKLCVVLHTHFEGTTRTGICKHAREIFLNRTKDVVKLLWVVINPFSSTNWLLIYTIGNWNGVCFCSYSSILFQKGIDYSRTGEQSGKTERRKAVSLIIQTPKSWKWHEWSVRLLKISGKFALDSIESTRTEGIKSNVWPESTEPAKFSWVTPPNAAMPFWVS